MGELLTWLLVAAALSLLAGGLAWRRAAARRAGAEREAKRLAEEAAEAQRLAAGQAERERAAAAEREARAAFEREQAARVDAQRRMALRAEAERLAAEQTERERQAAARAEAESAAAKSAAIAEAQRQAVLRAEVERRLAEQAERERLAADRAAQAERERVAPAQSAAPVTPATKSPAQTLVMVADDSKVVRIKTGRLLSAHQYQVCYASDGLEAQQLMRTQKPDVVITDVEMPGMDGFELTCHIRSQAATAQVPVIMITAADERHREQAGQAGVTVLLGKPYPEEVLLAHIRQAMGQDAAPRQPVGSNAHGRLDALA